MPLARKINMRTPARRQRGAAAVLAMMFLVIFSSLAAAMAIVAQGNLTSADSFLKVNRALAAAETGLRFVAYRIDQVTPTVTTTEGLIDSTNAPDLWLQVRTALQTSLTGEAHNLVEPALEGVTLRVGPIALGDQSPPFTAWLTPHPIAGENYNSNYYQRAPYNHLIPAVSNAHPLDSTWVRLRVESADGPPGHAITRSVQVDMRIDKKIRYAIISKSRIMIGRNVLIQGAIGSRFEETNLANGHPVQMESDFMGLDSQLAQTIQTFINTLAVNDHNRDNRLNLEDDSETQGMTNPQQYDHNHDGFVDDFDFFLTHYDTNDDGQVSATELNTTGNVDAAQLMELIDTSGNPLREGYNDGVIDEKDQYAKIRGKVMVTANLQGWQDGAGGGQFQNYFQGPIIPSHGEAPLTFETDTNSLRPFEASDFDVSSFRDRASGDLATQATVQAAQYDPNNPHSPRPLGTQAFEAVPYGAAHPYDYYDRPVYENMAFTDVKIPPGSNALFKNCTFVGCTFIQSTSDNSDPMFNYAGMQNADGSQKHPDRVAAVNGQKVANTKTVSNNIRFEGCTFEGALVSDAPPQFTHVRNKIAFTGRTRFNLDSPHLTDQEKALYRRSTILAPNYSVEMGTFVSPADSNETVVLSGTIVAGILDMRGQVKVNGTILTTFEPHSNLGPVMGETSPQFNTTLGYFPSSAGDLEAELPPHGIGVIQLRYDPTLPLPDGILGPIEVKPVMASYFEGGM